MTKYYKMMKDLFYSILLKKNPQAFEEMKAPTSIG
jgi:hypothetical protein